MVYCGKPSRGCENCRARRLKCDQKRPGCGQCRNTRRTCLGYRDANDFVFRDESPQIIIKCEKAEAKKAKEVRSLSKKTKNAQSCYSAPGFPRYSKSLKQLRIPLSLNHPIQDVAINFLLGDYIRGSHFDYLPSLYGTNQTNSVLSPIVKAVGLACLSLHTSRLELQDDAQKLYVNAIARTNTALQSADAARNDDVLASILLLSLYETLSPDTRVNVDAWTTHMQGALALSALRGPCQFKSNFGLELFKQIAASIRVFCVQHIIRIPQQLRELTIIASRHSRPNDVSFEIPCIVEAFTDLRADMAEGTIIEPDDIIARAQDVLAMIEDFYSNLPRDWMYDTVLTHDLSSEVHSNYYHKFKDHHVAQIWNTTWMAKLHLNGLIYEQESYLIGTSSLLLSGGADAVAVLNGCQQEVVEAAENICASVPQSFPPGTASNLRGSSRTAAMGYFLIWPLFTAGASPLILPSMRTVYCRSTGLYCPGFETSASTQSSENAVSG